jgi:hypothetical protein
MALDLSASNVSQYALVLLIAAIVANQSLKSITDWTTKQVLGWSKNRILSETSNRDDKQGNERALNIEEKLQKRLDSKEEKISDYERMIRGLKDENISKKSIIEQYWRPLPAIIITFFMDYSESDKSKKFIKSYINENNEAEMLTGNTYAIPPKGFPERFDNPSEVGRKEIEEWIQKDILGEYPTGRAVICQASAVDLRRVYSHTDYEEHSFNRKTIEQALDIESILSEHNVHRILARENVNLSKAIEKGDIAFFLSRYLEPDELEEIHANQKEIRAELGNPPLRKIAKDEFAEKLAEAISEWVAEPIDPARRAVEEAKLWHEELQT